MKTNEHLWLYSYIAGFFFLEWEMLQREVADEMKYAVVEEGSQTARADLRKTTI